jgi:biotin synthase-related radical SAM superfamily protein
MLKRLDIEGTVILKRKSAWVKRFAKVQNCSFSYKNKASDKTEKLKFDLRTAIVKLSHAGDERK